MKLVTPGTLGMKKKKIYIHSGLIILYEFSVIYKEKHP